MVSRYLLLKFCDISVTLYTLTSHLLCTVSKELGPLHVHVNTTEQPPELVPARWDDRHATLKATILVNIVKELPKLNPFNGGIFGPYDASLPDLHFER